LLIKRIIKYKMDKAPFNSSICIKPWTHLNILPSGIVRPCCIMRDDSSSTIGNLHEQSLEEIWNNPKMKQLRKDMLEDKKPSLCERCYKHEAAGTGSARMAHNNGFLEELARVPFHTDEDGHNNRFDLIYWDFRFSNKCNLRCRSCGPAYSSSWVPDAKKLSTSNAEREKLTKFEYVDGKSNIDFIKEHVSKVKRIYFAGGEPLIMDEHYEILDMLVAVNNTNCSLSYNTNLQTLSYKNWNVIDYWKKWDNKNLSISPSLDDIGERAELIRKGTDWKRTEDNLKTLVKEGFNVRPNITTGALNVFRLPEILTYFYKNKVLNKEQLCRNFNINIIDHPEHLHIRALPDDFKQKTKKKLLKFIDEFKKTSGCDISLRFSYVLQILDEPHVPEWKNAFVSFNKQLDEIRNEQLYEVIPELKFMVG